MLRINRLNQSILNMETKLRENGGIAMIISLIRTLLLYIVIIIAVRLMGKRQISELQTSELVVTLRHCGNSYAGYRTTIGEWFYPHCSVGDV